MTTYTTITSSGKRRNVEAANLAELVGKAGSKRTQVAVYLSNGFFLGTIMTTGELVAAF